MSLANSAVSLKSEEVISASFLLSWSIATCFVCGGISMNRALIISSGVASVLSTSRGMGNLEGIACLSFGPNILHAKASVRSRCALRNVSDARRNAVKSHIIISLSVDFADFGEGVQECPCRISGHVGINIR